jgi:hypothetical protein
MKPWWLVVAGLLTLVVEFFVCWVPAGMSNGQLYLGPVLAFTLLAVCFFAAAYAWQDCRTNGGLTRVMKIFGTVYFGYKVVIGTARHLHHAITRD